jgi:DNA-binding HxlR family transcriptional regulator
MGAAMPRVPEKLLPPPRSHCPIKFALEVLGDRWTLLIVRDLLFKGKHYFREFADSEERIATNILTDRLAKLEERGIVTREQEAHNRRNVRYELTGKGRDLAAILIEMIRWSGKYDPLTAAPRSFLRRIEREREELLRELVKASE